MDVVLVIFIIMNYDGKRKLICVYIFKYIYVWNWWCCMKNILNESNKIYKKERVEYVSLLEIWSVKGGKGYYFVIVSIWVCRDVNN